MDTLTLCRLACSDMQIKKGFGGVYASDCLPRDKGLFKSFIVNLDPKNEPGSHWVAIFFHNGVAYYFDSYGHFPDNRNIVRFLTQNSNDVRCSFYTYQNFDTFTCGHFCLYFLNRRSRHLELSGLDRNNRQKNETFITLFVSKTFTLSDCCASYHDHTHRQACRALRNVTQGSIRHSPVNHGTLRIPPQVQRGQ